MEVEISPDGEWAAATCYGTIDASYNTIIPSSLRVVRIDGSAAWSIPFDDYARGASFDRKDLIIPHHWSANGKYLYATAYSRMSGCCWLSPYIMLIRLNLSTGRQDAILNSLPSRFYTFDFWFSPDDRFLVYTDDLNSRVVVRDLVNWQIDVFDVEIPRLTGIASPLMSPDGDRVIIVVLLLVENPSYELETTQGMVLLYLDDASAEILMENDAFEPVRWEDEVHVLVSRNPGHPTLEENWLLNVETGELTKLEDTN